MPKISYFSEEVTSFVDMSHLFGEAPFITFCLRWSPKYNHILVDFSWTGHCCTTATTVKFVPRCQYPSQPCLIWDLSLGSYQRKIGILKHALNNSERGQSWSWPRGWLWGSILSPWAGVETTMFWPFLQTNGPECWLQPKPFGLIDFQSRKTFFFWQTPFN